jgi:hypothetical protein
VESGLTGGCGNALGIQKLGFVGIAYTLAGFLSYFTGAVNFRKCLHVNDITLILSLAILVGIGIAI